MYETAVACSLEDVSEMRLVLTDFSKLLPPLKPVNYSKYTVNVTGIFVQISKTDNQKNLLSQIRFDLKEDK